MRPSHQAFDFVSSAGRSKKMVPLGFWELGIRGNFKGLKFKGFLIKSSFEASKGGFNRGSMM